MNEADIARALAPRRTKRRAFGPRAMAAVVRALEKGATIAEAAEAAGHGLSTVYAWRGKSAAFAQAWEAAVEASRAPMLVAGGPGRPLRLVRERRTRFSEARKIAFLEHFAATCDATASAREVGVSLSSVYAHRNSDPAFASGWKEALEQGLWALEAELVRQRLEAKQLDFRTDKAVAGADEDFDRTMQLLRAHKRGLAGNGNAGRPARPWSFDEAIAALEKKLRGLGVPIVEVGMSAGPPRAPALAPTPLPQRGEGL